jgi:hypothetical protein
MKKHTLLILLCLTGLIAAASNYYTYTSSVKDEREYLNTIAVLEQTIADKNLELSQQKIDMEILSSAVTYLAEEYMNLYAAYCQCCEPKVPM